VTAAASGWLNWTFAADPTSKLCQLIAPRSEDWLIVVLPGAWAMLADPPTTTPPCGVVLGAICATATSGDKIAERAVLPMRNPRRRQNLSRARANCILRSLFALDVAAPPPETISVWARGNPNCNKITRPPTAVNAWRRFFITLKFSPRVCDGGHTPGEISPDTRQTRC
jgi:hypothetical protein